MTGPIYRIPRVLKPCTSPWTRNVVPRAGRRPPAECQAEQPRMTRKARDSLLRCATALDTLLLSWGAWLEQRVDGGYKMTQGENGG